MASLENGDIDAMNNIELLYNLNYKNKNEKLLELYTKFPKMVNKNELIKFIKNILIEELNEEQKLKFTEFIINFEFDDDDSIPWILKMYINSIKNNIDLMELHFKYTINGLGYNDAKKDYLCKLINKKDNN